MLRANAERIQSDEADKGRRVAAEFFQRLADIGDAGDEAAILASWFGRWRILGFGHRGNQLARRLAADIDAGGILARQLQQVARASSVDTSELARIDACIGGGFPLQLTAKARRGR